MQKVGTCKVGIGEDEPEGEVELAKRALDVAREGTRLEQIAMNDVLTSKASIVKSLIATKKISYDQAVEVWSELLASHVVAYRKSFESTVEKADAYTLALHCAGLL